MKELLIIKIGGQIVDEVNALERFLKALCAIKTPCLLVHGGGKMATRLCEQLDIPVKMIEGRRVTDASTLNVIVQIYGGSINKQLVAHLQAIGKNAIGLSGADGDLIRAKKRDHPEIDYGFVGDITHVNTSLLDLLLKEGLLPVLAPITHTGNGQLLNTNADTMAQTIASSMARTHKITLVFGFEKPGVLRDNDDQSSVIRQITASDFKALKTKGIVKEGMIPKLENAFEAVKAGVDRVIIGKADELERLLNGTAGTTLINE